MVALARDFDLFASGITTGISAVLLSFRYFANARDMRAPFHLCGSHDSSPPESAFSRAPVIDSRALQSPG
jgi:hypothetical protein